MDERPSQSGVSPDSGSYEIRLSGHLDARWAAWFDGMSIHRESDGTTVISGPIADQAALHGVLQRARDLGLPLVSVIRIGAECSSCRATEPRSASPTQDKEKT
jgi:hypothetical protein